MNDFDAHAALTQSAAERKPQPVHDRRARCSPWITAGVWLIATPALFVLAAVGVGALLAAFIY